MDTIQVPCRGCKKLTAVPSGRYNAFMRRRESYVVFCSRKCEVTYIATEGTRQQEESIRAEFSAAGESAD